MKLISLIIRLVFGNKNPEISWKTYGKRRT
jgi:hypothetical protein